MNKAKELKIGSSLDEMFRVEQFVEEISDEYMLYGNYFGNILMAVTEAVQNAIIHGNRLEKGKEVRIIAESIKEGLIISVIDRGEGFDHKTYSQTIGAGNVASLEKNGLLLIHKLADEVKFQNNGRVIEMMFRINGIDQSIFERRVAFMQDFFRVYQRLNT
jgi:serine/threonine-protein kinase RsbW